jgi:hypothetical protein
MKENVPNLENFQTIFRRQIKCQKCKNQSVRFILDKDKHAYEWVLTFNVSENNDVMVNTQLMMGSKINL